MNIVTLWLYEDTMELNYILENVLNVKTLFSEIITYSLVNGLGNLEVYCLTPKVS